MIFASKKSLVGKRGREARGLHVCLMKGQCGRWYAHSHWQKKGRTFLGFLSSLCHLQGDHLPRELRQRKVIRLSTLISLFAPWIPLCGTNISLLPAVLTDPGPRRYKSVWHSNSSSEFFPYLGVQPATTISIPTLCQAVKWHICWCSCEGSWHCPLHSANLESLLWGSQGGNEGFPARHWEMGVCKIMPPVKQMV